MVACQALGVTLNWTVAEERNDRARASGRGVRREGARGLSCTGYYAATAPMRKKKGKGIVPMALRFLERSCDMSNPDTGCYELAEALMSGTYVARDAKRGGELAIRPCDAENRRAAWRGCVRAWAGGAAGRDEGRRRVHESVQRFGRARMSGARKAHPHRQRDERKTQRRPSGSCSAQKS